MKKNILPYLLGLCLISFGVLNTSCSKKVGCPVNESVNTKGGKKGLSKKKGKSNLFPKGMR